jgi:tetratricopeptide (TPR) repeat protein
VLWRDCRAAETEHALERAIELAGATGDRRAEERALHLLIGALVLGPTPVPLAIERCLAIRREHEERAYVAAAAERGLALLHAMLGDFATARTHVANDKALLARIDSPVAATDAASPHAAVALESGDAEEAERELRGAHDELVTIGERSMRTAVAAELANVLAELGRHDEALSFAEEAGEDAPPLHLTAQVPRRLAQSRVHRERGDGETAERFAREAVELAGRSDFLPLLASSYLELAYVLRMHDAAAARSAARRAQRAAQRKRHTVLARRAAAV